MQSPRNIGTNMDLARSMERIRGGSRFMKCDNRELFNPPVINTDNSDIKLDKRKNLWEKRKFVLFPNSNRC